MPCNKDTCGNFTPAGDGSGEVCSTPCGVTCDRQIWPVWDTSRINVPNWNRDRVMYYYDDVCEQSLLHTADGGTAPGETNPIEYGLSGVENPNAGKVRKNLTGGYWWQGNGTLCPPTLYRGAGQTVGSSQQVRYWDHYPSEQSFEPIRSDTWFSYLYDTSKGVTGKPCYVYCYYMYTLSYSSGGKGGTGYNTYYGIRKVPYTCNCDPGETYINYSLEDGKITPEEETDPYPLVWTVGTKQQRIAFSYPGAVMESSVTIRAVGISTIKDTLQLGPWTLMYTTSGGSITELYSELGAGENLLKSQDPSHRYNTEIECRNGSTVVARLNAILRPVTGTGDGSLRPDTMFKIIGIQTTSDSSSIISGNVYDLYVRGESRTKNTGRFFKFGEVKFDSIVKSNLNKNVPTTFHMGEPKQVTGTVGANLSSLGFYEIWNGGRVCSYMSSQGSYWKSKNTKAIQDYSLPNGTVIRCEISSYYDDAAAKFYTRWKILDIVRYGNGYVQGDGTTYSNQNVYYLYYPNETDPNRVGVSLMISGTRSGDWSKGSTKIQAGSTINGWTISQVKHSDDEFNLHVAYLTDGTNDFVKDNTYTSSSGIQVQVKAGWGIKDRAAIIGKYEFQRKEVTYVTAYGNADVPQDDLDVIKPKLQSVVVNGKVTEIQILNPGKNLKDPNIEPIKIGIQEPPGYLNRDLYLQLVADGEDPETARQKARGGSKQAFCEPVFSGEVLTSIKIIDGGSGYSAEKPPNVAVPYIAKKYTDVVVAASSAEKEEPGVMEMFKQSEVFKSLGNKTFSYNQYEWDEKNPLKVQTRVTDVAGEFQGKNKFDITKTKSKSIQKNGYTAKDYSKQQSTTYAEKSVVQLKGSIKGLERAKDKLIYVRPKSGLSKQAAQAFLPPSNKNHVSTKNNDYTSLLSSIESQTKINVSYYASFSTNQKTLIDRGTLNPSVLNKINDGLDEQQRKDLASLPSVNSSTTTPAVANTIEPTDSYSKTSIEQIKALKITASNLDDGSYYNKEFRNFYIKNNFVSGESAKKFEATLNKIDKIYEDNINSMWQMDLDENRTIVYDGATTRIAKNGFFNLPCATRDTKYLVQNYCPDPRKNTFMNITVGVKILGVNETDQRGPCQQCLYDNATVLAAYNNLVNQYGSGNVDISDAYCATYTFSTDYSGQSDGVARRIPFGNYTLPYTLAGFTGYTNSYVKTQFANQYTYEGCRNYEFNGILEILHDRTLETQTFVQAVRRYGNPYDFMCGTGYYEDNESIDLAAINNITSATMEYYSGAVAQLSNPTSYSE